MTNNLWIPHTGGDCPVDPDTVVEVMLADGSLHPPRLAKDVLWNNSMHLDWMRIVLYRIVEQPKADWEKFFMKYGGFIIKTDWGCVFTFNELYEAFAARLKAEGRG